VSRLPPKRSLDGAPPTVGESALLRVRVGHPPVEPYHLDRYVTEQAFRFNNRKNKSDYDRFVQAVSQIQGKRLTYAEVTGKVQETPF